MLNLILYNQAAQQLITAGDLDWQRRIQPTTKGDFPVQKTLQERNAQVLPESSY